MGSEVEEYWGTMKEPCVAKKQELTGYPIYPGMRRSEEGASLVSSGPPVKVWRLLPTTSASLTFFPWPIISLPDGFVPLLVKNSHGI